MIQKAQTSDIYAVFSLDGRPLCWACGKRPPKLEGRWCSGRCKLDGETIIAGTPVPEEIKRATKSIIATWSVEEAARRRRGLILRGWQR